ncbi:glycosyl hydrolase family 28-related protein [Streptomyces sp. NPDC058252]|uniref:right-handed parallel beta-helix repeat-containing protein n=1 Tax=Streptomyces sp. NPDC058252 TaxID=3346405 RepID=UPI0036E4A909
MILSTPSVDQENWATPLNNALASLNSGKMDVDSLMLNVKDHGAKADDTTDDSQAIQALIDTAPQGAVVYLPPGKYRLAAPLRVSNGVTLRGGGWNPHFVPRTNMVAAYLRPATAGNFVGNSLIIVNPAPVNGPYIDSAFGGGPRIEGLALNGKNVTNSTGGNIAAISISSGVKDVAVRNVSIWGFTGDGIYSDNGAGMQFRNVVISTNGGVGFNITSTTTGGATDVDLIECYSQGNGGDGFILKNPNAVSMMGCRSEWNAGYGYNFTGLNFSLVMIGCNTDRSGKHGFHFNCLDGGKLPLLVGCQAKRDGANAGTWAGFNFQGTDGTTQAPGAVLSGCSTYVGLNDDSTGTRSPAYGIQTQFTRRVQISGGWVEGTSAAYNDASLCISKASGVVQNTVDISTGVMTTSNSDRMDINGATGATRALRYFTRGGGERWEARTNSTAESGSNAGSDYQIARFNDAGTEIDVPLTVFRSTGEAKFAKSLSSDGPALGQPTPITANGYTTWTGDPELAQTSNSAAPGGTLLLRMMFISRSTTITKAFIQTATGSTSPTTAQNWVGLYDINGNLLGSADITSQVSVAQFITATFSSGIPVTPGKYYLALLFNGTTNAAPYRSAGSLIAAMNGNVTANNYRACTNGSGLTALPATFTPANNSQSNAQAYWAALG